MTTNLFDLDGKIALITGASRGIGRAIAELLAEQGAHVIVTSRKADDCEAVAADIVAAGANGMGDSTSWSTTPRPTPTSATYWTRPRRRSRRPWT